MQVHNEPLNSILVIRRDNIGDLVCTLPLIAALRTKYPKARIEALVNSYNCDVLEGHPDLNAVHAYSKGKHRADESLLGVYWRRFKLLWSLRGRFDCVILAAPGEQPRSLGYARLIRPRHILGFVSPDTTLRGIDWAVPYQPDAQAHEVEKVFALLAPLGIEPPIPAARIMPNAMALSNAQRALASLSDAASQTGPVVGLHISARKPSQRWSVESFAALGKALCKEHSVRLMVMWAPGDASNKQHPGDDAKAQTLMAALQGLPAIAYPTTQLADLIAGLAVCDSVICADGGAMHLAAGLGKPIVALFGDSDPSRWKPWGVPHGVLQPPSRDVKDITPEGVLESWSSLQSAR
jgi:ADP-heptose:LPS heptosyltransferase